MEKVNALKIRNNLGEILDRLNNNGEPIYIIKLGLTGYDACYAALAKDLSGLWLTFDKRAHRMIKKVKVSLFLEEEMPPSWPG